MQAEHDDSPQSLEDSGEFAAAHLTTGSILVVDDDAVSLGVLDDLLTMNGFRVMMAEEGRQAMEIFSASRPDLVITDIRMPNMDGLEVLREVRKLDDIVPVVLVTGHGDLENALRALRRGAYDFLLKPINPEILINTVQKGLDHYRLRRFEQESRRVLEALVQERTADLARANVFLHRLQAASIFALAKLAESRDGETAFHLKRLQAYCRALCCRLASKERYRAIMTDKFIDDLVQCSVLHDIGKVAIPDAILFNPRRFGINEYEIMKKHAIFGGKALEEAAEEAAGEAGDEESFLTLGKDVAYYHHEHWDGTGYPFGLEGEEIPLAARIVAIADVYDALTTQRRYKKAYSHEEACRVILIDKGRKFDPDLVEAFVEIRDEFCSIRDMHSRPGQHVKNGIPTTASTDT